MQNIRQVHYQIGSTDQDSVCYVDSDNLLLHLPDSLENESTQEDNINDFTDEVLFQIIRYESLGQNDRDALNHLFSNFDN